MSDIADGGAFGGTQPLDLSCVGVQFEISPGRAGVGRDDLDRLGELLVEPCGQVGVSVDHCVHGIAKAVGVQRAGDGDVQLHGVHVVVAAGGVGVEQQSLLQRGQRQHIGDPVMLLQFVELPLAEPGGGDVGGGQSAAAVVDVGADAGQRFEPQPAQPGDLDVVQGRRRPGPGGVQDWAAAVVDGAGVEFHRVSQRHRHRGRCSGDRQAVLADPPQPARGFPPVVLRRPR